MTKDIESTNHNNNKNWEITVMCESEENFEPEKKIINDHLRGGKTSVWQKLFGKKKNCYEESNKKYNRDRKYQNEFEKDKRLQNLGYKVHIPTKETQNQICPTKCSLPLQKRGCGCHLYFCIDSKRKALESALNNKKNTDREKTRIKKIHKCSENKFETSDSDLDKILQLQNVKCSTSTTDLMSEKSMSPERKRKEKNPKNQESISAFSLASNSQHNYELNYQTLEIKPQNFREIQQRIDSNENNENNSSNILDKKNYYLTNVINAEKSTSVPNIYSSRNNSNEVYETKTVIVNNLNLISEENKQKSGTKENTENKSISDNADLNGNVQTLNLEMNSYSEDKKKKIKGGILRNFDELPVLTNYISYPVYIDDDTNYISKEKQKKISFVPQMNIDFEEEYYDDYQRNKSVRNTISRKSEFFANRKSQFECRISQILRKLNNIEDKILELEKASGDKNILMGIQCKSKPCKSNISIKLNDQIEKKQIHGSTLLAINPSASRASQMIEIKSINENVYINSPTQVHVKPVKRMRAGSSKPKQALSRSSEKLDAFTIASKSHPFPKSSIGKTPRTGMDCSKRNQISHISVLGDEWRRISEELKV